MSRKDDLENNIRESYNIMRDYEAIIRTSERPEEKARARRITEEQLPLVIGYLAEYHDLVDDALPEDLAQIENMVKRLAGEMQTTQPGSAVSTEKPKFESATSNAQSGCILIVTVTKVEAQAVLDVFSQATGKKCTRYAIGGKTYYDLGIHGDASVSMVQSEVGIATPGGALLTVHQAIQDLRPQAVIMCGIAFGLRPEKQKLGDILVAKQLQYYEPQKVDLQRGQMPRGDRITSAERLLDRFRSGDIDWRGAQTHFGLVLSGEKLINDPVLRDRLLKTEPEAVGGEMEGAGLYVAARDAKVDWILVKAICDWADGNKNDDVQLQAARNAAQFVLHVLQLGGWRIPEQPRRLSCSVSCMITVIFTIVILFLGSFFIVPRWPQKIIYLLLPSPTAAGFSYQVQVQTKAQDNHVAGAIVVIEVEGKASLNGTTDTKGLVKIWMPASYAEQQAKLIVQKTGYVRYERVVILAQDVSPMTVEIEPEATPTPEITPTPIPMVHTLTITISLETPPETTIVITRSSPIVELIPVKGDTTVTIDVQALDQRGEAMVPDTLIYHWKLELNGQDKRNIPPTDLRTHTWSFRPPTDILTETVIIAVSDEANNHIMATIPFTITLY